MTLRPDAGWLWQAAAVAIAVVLGFALRLHDYSVIPPFLDNADELQFAWAGLTLITQGDSFTWSYFPAYPDPTLFVAHGTTFPMVHHWLDHPPGFSLVVGGLAWLFGDRSLLDVSAAQIRLLPVALATLTIPLTYVLGSRVLGRWPALLGVLLLATAPGAVLFSRQVEPESLLAPLLLVALIAAQRLLGGEGGPVWLAVAIGCSLVAPMLKVPGIAIGGVCAAILLTGGRWQAAVALVGAAAAGLLGYVAWGAHVDWAIFVKVIQGQAMNRSGVMSAFEFIASAAGFNRRLRDGWWLLGWIAMGLWLVQGRRSPRELVLAWPIAAYLLAIMVLAGERLTAQFGWYRIILYPEVYLAAGYLIWRAVVSPSLARLGITLALGGATAAQLSLGSPWVPNPVLLVGLLAAVLVPAAVAAWRREPGWTRLAQTVAGATVAALLLLNVVASWRLVQVFDRL